MAVWRNRHLVDHPVRGHRLLLEVVGHQLTVA
jgi:hypothetical protein